jgi:hypothetical protein
MTDVALPMLHLSDGDELSPRDPILPIPFTFRLRRYSQWLYRFISRYNFGSQSPYGDWTQTPKAVLKRAMSSGNFRYVEKLTEWHIKAHLEETMTYYYTGSRRQNVLLLCHDLDSHEGQPDAPALADYYAAKYLRDNCCIEPSTHKIGRHMYSLVSFDPYLPTATLFTLTRELNGLMEADRKRAGFQANLDPDTGGLPSDWKHDKMAHLIKLPRPKTEEDLQRLLALTPMPLEGLVAAARQVAPSPASFCSTNAVTPKGEVMPCVSNSIIDCGTQPIIDSKTQDAPQSPLGKPCVSNSIIDCDDKRHATEEVEADIQNRQPRKPSSLTRVTESLSDIRQRQPLYRALWTVRGLARAYGRMPTIAEALAVYEEFGIGTGPCTPQRIRRFEDAIAYTARTFDPKKVRRRGFLREYPFLKRRIEQAIAKNPVSLRHKRNVLTIDNLCVALFFAQFQLSRGDDKTNCGTLPIKGIVNLSKKLKQDHGMACIPNQKASACRRILCKLGLLERTDNDFQYWGVRRAKRYRLKEAD